MTLAVRKQRGGYEGDWAPSVVACLPVPRSESGGGLAAPRLLKRPWYCDLPHWTWLAFFFAFCECVRVF